MCARVTRCTHLTVDAHAGYTRTVEEKAKDNAKAKDNSQATRDARTVEERAKAKDKAKATRDALGSTRDKGTIQRGLQRAAANREALARLRVSPEDILSFDTPQAAAIVQDIIEKEGLVQFFNNAAIYFGTTSCRLELEALRFVVQKYYQAKPDSQFIGNRAVLLKGETEPPRDRAVEKEVV